MKRLFFLLLIILSYFPFTTFAQTQRTEGLRENTPAVFAFINATIVTKPGGQLNNGTIVIRDGIIEDVGRRVNIPSDAWIYDLEGMVIYPGFIDLFSHYGLPDSIQYEEHIHWNPQIRSQHRAVEHFVTDSEHAARMRSQGFTIVQSVPRHGLMKGNSVVVSLGATPANRQIIKADGSQALSFRLTERRSRSYPTSQMGAIALLRQTLLDAQWYDAVNSVYEQTTGLPRPEQNIALERLFETMKHEKPFIMHTSDENEFIRAARLSEEFGLNTWVLGSGKEYRRLEALRAKKLPVILPINFPETPKVETPEKAMAVSLEDLRHWYLAPENPARIAKAGIKFSLSAYGGEKDFLNNLRKAIDRGLKEQDALAALTEVPAEMLGIDKHYGSLKKGKVANFIIADGNIFDDQATIKSTWIDGVQFKVCEKEINPAGIWKISGYEPLEGVRIRIDRQQNRLSGKIEKDDKKISVQQLQLDNNRISFSFSGDSIDIEGTFRLSAHVAKKEMLGSGITANNDFFTWTAGLQEAFQEKEQQKREWHQPIELPGRYPSMEYGIPHPPEQPRHILIKNATIWTQGEAGIIEDADMLITRGIITRIGFDLEVPLGTHVIDAAGKHVTPGLIDPHIHTSIMGGVNETGSAITSETRITDVMHGDNVWVYRLLAGGITSATLFHGSANPIGGQNAVIKMRWGALAEEMLIGDAAPGLKFALGENVKGMATRYPNTRQGTGQIIKDALQAAVEYEQARKMYMEERQGLPVRRDLQLEAILEVINGQRKAHVHAYRQDEMLMMLRLAEMYGFTIGSFEHTLEGYKIADELRAHGAGAVIWTDWSSFKVEAQDGILHNARLLNEVGVLTSLHSDNTQLSTRMNWEAAKTVKTGVSETDAMNFITLHPAKIMGIDHRVGSLEAGKDADFIIWTGHPLSSFSIPQQTWLDGRKYFDRSEDMQRRKEVQAERAKIIDYILQND